MVTMESYTRNNTDKLIDEFCEVIAVDLLNRSKEPGVDVWPRPIFSPSEGVYFIHKELLSGLHTVLELLEQNGLTSLEIAKLFMYPSRIVHLMYQFLEKPTSKIETHRRTQVAKNLLQYIDILRNGNLFCKNKKNTVWSSEEITNVLSNLPIKNVSNLSEAEKTKSIVSQIIVALSCYCELLYFANLAFGREYHGPYVVNLGQILVREFYDLKPSFWNFSQNFPFTTAKFLTVYPQSLEIQFDFAGRLYIHQPLGPQLLGIYIEIDGKPISVENEKLEQIFKMIQKSINEALKEIKDMTKVQLMTKYVEAHFWVLKPLNDRVNIEWQPSQELYTRIQVEQPEPHHLRILKTLKDYTKDERVKIMMMLFDPRCSFDDIKQFDPRF